MDKMGHMFTAYMYTSYLSDIARWTGVESKKADWIGFGTAMLFQTTIEIMDGYSDRWGFSWSDMAFNAIGAGLYIGQQRLWHEQRILLKFSSTPVSHPDYLVTSEDGGLIGESLPVLPIGGHFLSIKNILVEKPYLSLDIFQAPEDLR